MDCLLAKSEKLSLSSMDAIGGGKKKKKDQNPSKLQAPLTFPWQCDCLLIHWFWKRFDDRRTLLSAYVV